MRSFWNKKPAAAAATSDPASWPSWNQTRGAGAPLGVMHHGNGLTIVLGEQQYIVHERDKARKGIVHQTPDGPVTANRQLLPGELEWAQRQIRDRYEQQAKEEKQWAAGSSSETSWDSGAAGAGRSSGELAQDLGDALRREMTHRADGHFTVGIINTGSGRVQARNIAIGDRATAVWVGGNPAHPQRSPSAPESAPAGHPPQTPSASASEKTEPEPPGSRTPEPSAAQAGPDPAGRWTDREAELCRNPARSPARRRDERPTSSRPARPSRAHRPGRPGTAGGDPDAPAC